MSKATILVADDDRLILATLVQGLKENGYEVIDASSGDEAVAICAEVKPNLAILDIRMPGMNGIETACELQEKYDVPFMIFSAYGDSQLVQESIEKGALGYLIKPLDVPQVIPSIETALERATQISKLKDTEFHLNRALNTGRETSTAVGVIMERHRLSGAQAFDKLRSVARSQRRKLWDVASDIVQATEATNFSDSPLKKTRGIDT